MLAQRSNANIDAVEKERNAFLQAKENNKNCPWNDRITIIHMPFQEFYPGVNKIYHLIVCNLRYFSNSLKAPSEERTTARHDDALPFEELINGLNKLLDDKGRLALILPYQQVEERIETATSRGLFCSRITYVYPHPDKPIIRCLLEFQKHEPSCIEDTLTIKKGRRHDYTDEYRALTKDFYLVF